MSNVGPVTSQSLVTKGIVPNVQFTYASRYGRVNFVLASRLELLKEVQRLQVRTYQQNCLKDCFTGKKTFYVSFSFLVNSILFEYKSHKLERKKINKPNKQNHNCCLGQSEYLLQNNKTTGQIQISFPFFSRRVWVFMAMFLTHAKLRDIFTCIRYFNHSSFSCFFLDEALFWPDGI